MNNNIWKKFDRKLRKRKLGENLKNFSKTFLKICD